MEEFCEICYQPIGDKPLALCISCYQDFHRSCIDTALEDSNRCPVCRDAFMDIESPELETVPDPTRDEEQKRLQESRDSVLVFLIAIFVTMTAGYIAPELLPDPNWLIWIRLGFLGSILMLAIVIIVSPNPGRDQTLPFRIKKVRNVFLILSFAAFFFEVWTFLWICLGAAGWIELIYRSERRMNAAEAE